MVYTVSDILAHDTPRQGARPVLRAKGRRAAGSISIHWPRVIALGLNILVWAVIIAVAWRALHH